MDRLEAMTMLLVVVEKGSLSAASRSLGVPVPTLSRKISDLEDVMNTRLLIRTTRKLTLTDAGLTYVGAARRILEQVEEAEREAAGEFTAPKGELIVTAPMVFGRMYVLPVVAEFLALFPEISVRLLLTDRNLQLIDEHVDLAIRVGKLPDSAMIATRVGSMRMVVCASRALLAGHGVPDTPEDLRRLPIVTFNWLASSATWQFRGSAAGAPLEISVAPRLSVSTAEAAVDAAARSVGVTRLFHYQAADAVEAGALQIVLEDFELAPAPIHLVHAARGQMPLKMRRFLDFATPKLRHALSRFASAP